MYFTHINLKSLMKGVLKMNSRFKLKLFSMFLVAIFMISSVQAFATSYSYTNQDVTAYVAPSGSRTASGLLPEVGYSAVHPTTWGSHTVPIFPFDAFIHTDFELSVPNASDMMSLFQVQDIGDVDNERGLTFYWFDIYIGVDTEQNIEKAINFGQNKVGYTVYW